LQSDLPHPAIAAPHKGAEASGDFAPVVEERCPDAAWRFRVLVPKAWSIGPGALAAPGADAPGEIGLYRPDSLLIELRVLGLPIDREVDPADWLELSPLLADRTVVSRRPVRTPAGVRGDVLAIWTEGDRALAGRYFAFKMGSRMFVLAAKAPVEHYTVFAEPLAISLGSFQPLDESGGRYAEPMQTHTEATPIAWTVTLPASWNVEPGSKGPDVASFQAENVRSEESEEDELVGKLACAVLARSAAKRPRQVASAYLDAVRENEIEIERDDFEEEDAGKPFERSWHLLSGVTRAGIRGELRCRVMQHRQVWLLAGVLSPTREDDAAAWMQNKRALDIVTGAVKLEAPG
jgi:hypothetical protein